ncbi:MAG: Hemerythrin [Herbinix sp.]|jgi:hemerythrin|nr:Hemerythrin [Herbinix sp.]
MMMWNDSFSVSNDEIDNQHKQLIEIIEELAIVIHNKDYSYANIIEIIGRLEDYIKVHFEYEENLMLKYSYPNIEHHTKEHNELRYKMQNMSVFDYNKPDIFYSETLTYLFDWLTKHIMQVDKQLGKYVLELSK